MSMARFGSKLAHIFSNDKKPSASSQAQTAAAELEAAQEKARKELLKLTKTARIGFPCKPTCMAYDPVQHLLAIGSRNGQVKLYGCESIEYTICHINNSNSGSNTSSSTLSNNNDKTQTFGSVTSFSSLNNNNGSGNGSPVPSSSSAVQSASASLIPPPAVQFMCFVINEGALITCCDDSTISFWNLRQKQPGIIFSRKLVNEK